MDDIIAYIDNFKNTDHLQLFEKIKNTQINKINILYNQLAELKNINYNIDRIYNLNIENNIEDSNFN